VTLDEYQQKASATDAAEIAKNPDLSVLFLGLAGETGSLLTLYKKRLRDGDAFQIVEERLSEEMGDILWYLAAIARCRAVLKSRNMFCRAVLRHSNPGIDRACLYSNPGPKLMHGKRIVSSLYLYPGQTSAGTLSGILVHHSGISVQ
jgi:NTP pyrophosphatase (non-canonical NTP hydrolase)